jgi:uncharacterized membrane protein YfbV (UPF0208 family)
MALRLKRCWNKKMAKGEMISSLRMQGVAILVMVSVAVLSVLGMIVLGEFQDSVPNATATINTTITAFIAGFALVGTFATVTMLVIVVKAIIGIVRGLR